MKILKRKSGNKIKNETEEKIQMLIGENNI